MSGTKKRTKGAMSLELVEADLESADAEKITVIQIRTGSQYRRNFCVRNTGRSKQVAIRGRNGIRPYLLIGFAKRSLLWQSKAAE